MEIFLSAEGTAKGVVTAALAEQQIAASTGAKTNSRMVFQWLGVVRQDNLAAGKMSTSRDGASAISPGVPLRQVSNGHSGRGHPVENPLAFSLAIPRECREAAG